MIDLGSMWEKMGLFRNEFGEIRFTVVFLLILSSVTLPFIYFMSIKTDDKPPVLLDREITFVEGKYKYKETVMVITIDKSGIGIPITKTVYVIYLENGEELKVSSQEFDEARPGKKVILETWKDGWYKYTKWEWG